MVEGEKRESNLSHHQSLISTLFSRAKSMLTIFESIRKEFSVNDKGESFCSRRAIARMSGKRLSTIQNLLQTIADRKLPHKMFKPFEGITFQVTDLIPDTLASLIVQYYAFKGSETAQEYLMAFSAIGPLS